MIMSSLQHPDFPPAALIDGCTSPRLKLHDLPSDVLCEIVLRIARPRRSPQESRIIFRDFLSIISVSRRLRDIGRSMRQVWAWHIDLSRSITSVKLLLELSHPIPLAVVHVVPHFICDPQCCLEGVALPGNHARYKHWDLLIQQNVLLNRCEALEFSVDYCMWDLLRLQIEPFLQQLQRLKITFKPDGIIFGHVLDSEAFPPGPFSSSCVFSQLTSLTLIGGFFHLDASMFPALKNLVIEMEPEDMRGFQDNPVTGTTQHIYQNWTAAEWHELLVGLPTLETVSLRHVIQLEDASLPKSQSFVETVKFFNLKALRIEDYHGCVAIFLRPCVVSPQCNITVRSGVFRNDLSTLDPININLASFLRNRFLSEEAVTQFGKIGYVKVVQKNSKTTVQTKSLRWDIEIRNTRCRGEDALESGLLDLKFTVSVASSNQKWIRLLFCMLYQLLAQGLCDPFQHIERLQFVLKAKEPQAFYDDAVSYRTLCRFIEKHCGHPSN